MSRYRIGTGVAAALVATAVAVDSALAQAPQPPSCAAEEHRQFDFWVGDWDVKDPQGTLVGTNSIERTLGGCVLIERWRSMTSAHAGTSYNIYDRATGRWHQTWVDNTGLLLQLDGAFQNESMVLSGERPGPDGTTVMHRITWGRPSTDRVRQLWETSTDGGETWNVAFDGLYVRR